jgi:hypothetical protein
MTPFEWYYDQGFRRHTGCAKQGGDGKDGIVPDRLCISCGAVSSESVRVDVTPDPLLQQVIVTP